MAKSKEVTLSPAEETLAQRINFDPAIFRLVKAYPLPELKQLTVSGVDGDHFPTDVPAPGFTFETSRVRAESLMRALRPKLKKAGYLIFLSELGGEDSKSVVAVIRGSEQYDILRLMRTADINGDQTNEDVIARLKEMEQRYSFYVVGANHDWVECRLKKFPADWATFTQEVISFAPDSYGQGDFEDEEHYTTAMRRAKAFQLWWD